MWRPARRIWLPSRFSIRTARPQPSLGRRPGQVPFGAEEDTPPQPLLAGVSYEVRVEWAGATQGGTQLVGGGAVTFTR